MTRFARARGLASTIVAFGLCSALAGSAFAKTLPTALLPSGPQGHILSLSDPLVDTKASAGSAGALFEVAQSHFRSGKYRRARQLLRGLVIRYPDSPQAAEARKILRRILAMLVESAQRSSLGVPYEPAGPSKLGVARIPIDSGWRIQVTRGPSAQDDLALVAGDRIFFTTGSTVLNANADKVLAAQAVWLKTHPDFGLVITGHADEPISEADNIVLSVERAKAVRDRLVAQGVAQERLRVAGFGNVKRVAVCKFAACLAQNRRVVSKVLRWSRREGLRQLTSR